ncbi:hypothetical protein Pan44_24890 [Caulifigura coniformis]|uniref:Na+-translocating membrane potential-generating system MpsC domain-containing protein n=1 Tax=Caulifigura coniformis TaxID=2527983 RepID=A0A517SEA6_9PLAN|nr:DUF2294 domain-containing protein [Caulifigura coniformis]QDT54456.1 hypothetical protein Pan44_24890 [Caulifigura coniformis]
MPATAVLKSRSSLEIEISRAIIRFEKEYMGRGPLETKTYVIDDLVVIRLKDVLTLAERKLIETQRDRSAYLVKQSRNELLAAARPMLEAVVRDITGVDVQSVHTDLSTRTGERIIVVTLKERLRFGDCDEGRVA